MINNFIYHLFIILLFQYFYYIKNQILKLKLIFNIIYYNYLFYLFILKFNFLFYLIKLNHFILIIKLIII